MRVDSIAFQPSGNDTPFSGHTNTTAAAKEFESVLLGQWLKDAQSSFATVPGNEDEDAGASQTMDFATQHLAKEIAARGGVGIANLVESALRKSTDEPYASSSTKAFGG
jgi:Rod binding domain-containing protein